VEGVSDNVSGSQTECSNASCTVGHTARSSSDGSDAGHDDICSVCLTSVLHRDECLKCDVRSQKIHRSFSVAGPKVRNSLPATLRQSDVEFGQFEKPLDVVVWRGCSALVTFCF